MNMIKSLIAILTISFLMTSCGDDGGLTLTVDSPNNDTVYNPGDIVDITGTATDDVAVVSLIFASSELNFSETVPVPSQQSVPFNFTINIVENSQLQDDIKIEVTAIDDEGNSITEERSISIQ